MTNRYDYIIAGAGCAGLSLTVRMILSGKFADKKILLLDKSPKTQNDRTWCFWEDKPGLFEPIVFKRWNKLSFYGNDGCGAVHDIHPYEYKLIRGIDFYTYCFNLIREQKNITVAYGNAECFYAKGEGAYVLFNGEKLFAQFVFNSIISGPPVLRKNEYYLLQHFRGWFIKTSRPAFNETTATLMDFRAEQQQATSFVYVMPFSSTEALVEFTQFSSSVLPHEAYEAALKKYCIERLNLDESEFSVMSRETGVIPMTNHAFAAGTGNLVNMGTAAGQTKGSSGYTFQFIQKNSSKIVEALIRGRKPQVPRDPKKFRFYDSILLNILAGGKLNGAEIFTTLFNNNQMKEVFKFLDNETSLAQDISIIRTLPRSIFARAAISHLLK